MVYMPILLRTSGVVSCLAAALFCPVASAQLSTPLGSEYSLSGPLLGDQMFPNVSIRSSGGYVVWQDNVIDGNGTGIGARKLDSTLSPTVLASFRVNQQTIGNQETPQIAVQTDGSAAIVWQGGLAAYQQVWLRALTTNGTFISTNDTRLNVYTNGPQTTPVIAALSGGNYGIAWASMHQDGSYRGIYMRLAGPTGALTTAPVQVNQFTPNNQRSPAIAALSGGGFVITWASENQGVSGVDLLAGTNRVHIYGRVYNGSGAALTDEFRVNTGSLICANPTVSACDGGFTVAWSQRDLVRSNSWEVFARCFNGDGSTTNPAFRVNSYTLGDQFAPRIAALGGVQMVIWSSLGQDGSWEGVYGRLLTQGAPNGDEFLVNSTTVSKQIQPTVTSDGGTRLLVIWSSYVGDTGFDLLGQRFAAGQPIPQPPPPFVSALSSSRLSVTWPPLSGFPVTGYEVYMDGLQPPDLPSALVTSNVWTKTGLSPASTHTFRLAYLMGGGQRSPLSDPAIATTWGEDENFDGLPDNWQAIYWGGKPEDWPAGNIDSDGDGASNASEYLAGTDPTDPASVLRTWLTRSAQGRRINWTTEPGLIYQVQVSSDFGLAWQNSGSPRFAAGNSDSIPISLIGRGAFYRIIRVR